MINHVTRPTGVKLRLLNVDKVTEDVKEEHGAFETGFGPYAVAEHGGTLYVLNTEGVGWVVTDEDPLQLDLYKKTEGRISIFPSLRATLTPAEVRELVTDTEVDLADHVRRFGARLEDNFWLWFRRLSAASKEA